MSAPVPPVPFVSAGVALGRALNAIAQGVRDADLDHPNEEPSRVRGDVAREAHRDRAEGRGLCPTHEALLQQGPRSRGLRGAGRGAVGPDRAGLKAFHVRPGQALRMLAEAIVLIAFFGSGLFWLIALVPEARG
jgi:hypothetical protein